MLERSQMAAHSIAMFRPGIITSPPESFGRDFNQDRNVDVSPDQQLYVKIVSLNSWGMSVSAAGTVRAMLSTPG